MGSYADLGLDSSAPYLGRLVESIAESIGCRTTKQMSCLRCLLANLLRNFDSHVRIRRGKVSHGPLRYNPYGIGYGPLRTVLTALANAGWIVQEIGVSAKRAEDRSTTKIYATRILLTTAEAYGWNKWSSSWNFRSDVVRLKDRSKVLVDYQDNEYTRTVRKHIEEFNDLVARCEIDCESGPVTDWRMRRTYLNGSFQQGGRMWGPWCDLSKAQRTYLTVNDEELEEIDYRAAHLNALYRYETGTWYPYLDDPYDVHVNGVIVPREFTKALATRAQSMSSTSSLGRSFLGDYRQDPRFVELNVRPVDIWNAFRAKHPTIVGHYLKGPEHGLWIQYLEAEMVFALVVSLTQKGILCLPVYDAVYVQSRHKQLALDLASDCATWSPPTHALSAAAPQHIDKSSICDGVPAGVISTHDIVVGF